RLPPAWLSGHRMVVDDVLVAGQCVADKHGVAARRVERAIGLIRDLKRRKIQSGIEPQRLVGAKAHDRRMRIVRFARAVGKIKRGAEIGHRCIQKAAVAERPATTRGRQNGVNRPLRRGVNVFFDFGLNDTYQIGTRTSPMSKSPSKSPSKSASKLPTKPASRSSRHAPPSLDDLRREIDRIDAAMHELLIER